MCTIAQAFVDQGRSEERLDIFYSLVNKHIIAPYIAAEELNVSLEELEKMFKQHESDMN